MTVLLIVYLYLYHSRYIIYIVLIVVRQKELYEKYQCYCKNGGTDLSTSIGDSSTKAMYMTSYAIT